MFEQVKEILLNYIEDGIEITEESRLAADLGLSSLDVVSIVIDFEDAFHIEIPDRDLGLFISVIDILNYLEDHV